MMLRPVELNTTRYPGAYQSYQRWLDDMIVIHKMALGNLIVGHLYTSAQFWQHHHLDILILQEYRLVFLINLFIADTLNNGIWIDYTAGTLIYSFFQEHRAFLGFSHLISWYCHQLSPCFN